MYLLCGSDGGDSWGSNAMRQIIALKASDEEQFLAIHPFWTVERRLEDHAGIAYLSCRVDVAAERKANRPTAIANRALALQSLPFISQGKPIYLGELRVPLSELRTVRYLPLPFETGPVVVITPPLAEVPKVRVFIAA